MNFTAPAFVLAFPFVLALHWVLPPQARWVLLLAASLGFYAVGSPQALPLLHLALPKVNTHSSKSAGWSVRCFCALAASACLNTQGFSARERPFCCPRASHFTHSRRLATSSTSTAGG